jgi:protein-tyrosine-phosphatase
VVAVMDELGIDLAKEFPKPLTTDAVRAADVVITMGCGDACPVFPGKRYLDWELEDPAGKTVDVGQSTVSAHLKALAEVRFVLADQHGTARFYRINQNCVTCFPTAAAQE